MAEIHGLRCKICGTAYDEDAGYVCENCFGPLEVDYVTSSLKAADRARVQDGPHSLWRYHQLLPQVSQPVDIGTGFTPLIKAERLGQALGLDELYVKNDAVNPTYSFKDRVVSAGISKALDLGFDTVACATTGNLGNAVSAHAARASVDCYIFYPEDLEPAKVTMNQVYGPHLVPVRGNYDEVNRFATEVLDEYPWAFLNINLRPYYAEGSKTLAFEVAEQLQWQSPDHVVVPVAGGALLTKIWEGFSLLEELGWLEHGHHAPRVSAAQADGCAPVSHAFLRNEDRILPEKPDTIAKSLAIGQPADGPFALNAIRESGGAAAAVSDDAIREGIQLLARTEGIFTETAGGVTVASLKQLVETGAITAGERTVIYITGNGLKTPSAAADGAARPQSIEADLAAFESLQSRKAGSPTDGGTFDHGRVKTVNTSSQ